MWFCARVLTAGDASSEIWEAAGQVQADRTAAELAHALPDDATITVLGWPDEISEALPRRGDVEVLAVDTRGEASGLVSQLWRADVEAVRRAPGRSGRGGGLGQPGAARVDRRSGPEEFLAVSGSRAAAAVARAAGIPVWLVAGVGRLLPGRMWEGLRGRVEPDEPWDADDEFVPLDLVDRIVGPGRPRAGGRRPAPHRLPGGPRALQGRRVLSG